MAELDGEEAVHEPDQRAGGKPDHGAQEPVIAKQPHRDRRRYSRQRQGPKPTERSNSPETMTKVMPTAMIETSAVLPADILEIGKSQEVRR